METLHLGSAPCWQQARALALPQGSNTPKTTTTTLCEMLQKEHGGLGARMAAWGGWYLKYIVSSKN